MPTAPSFVIPPTAVVREVGLRDGLQSLPVVLPTHTKCEWIDAAYLESAAPCSPSASS